MKRKLLSITLSAVLILSLACTKGELLNAAEDVLSSLQASQPLISQFLPSAGPKIEQAVTIAGKLKDAVSASQSAQALGLLTDLIPVFQSIVENDIPQLQSTALRTQLMAALALANIGLHLLVNRLKTNAPQAVSSNSALARFAAEPVWGEAYRTKK